MIYPSVDRARAGLRFAVLHRDDVVALRVLDLVMLLVGPGSRMLSADIFFWTVSGRQEAASVLALVQTALVRQDMRWQLLLGRAPQSA